MAHEDVRHAQPVFEDVGIKRRQEVQNPVARLRLFELVPFEGSPTFRHF